MPTPKPNLQSWCQTLCIDASFLVASCGEFDAEALTEMLRKRAEHYDRIIHRTAQEASWDSWLTTMSSATAATTPLRWLPMHEVVPMLTLEAGARGVRALFTSKPSDKQVQRARDVGRLALRGMTSVFSAAKAEQGDRQLQRACFVHALGLPDDAMAMLLAEDSATVDAIEIPPNLEAKVAKAVGRGLWDAAQRSGPAPEADAISAALCARLGMDGDVTDELRRASEAGLRARAVGGNAAVDAIRYVLSDDPEVALALATQAVRLIVAPALRSTAALSIDYASQVVLARKHDLDRNARQTALILAWLAALSTDPSTTRSAELAVRHDRVADDFGSRNEGASCRATVDAFVREALLPAVQAAGL